MGETKKAETNEVKEEIPKGFYLAQVPTEFANAIAFDGKQVDVLELLTNLANACKKAGILE